MFVYVFRIDGELSVFTTARKAVEHVKSLHNEFGLSDDHVYDADNKHVPLDGTPTAKLITVVNKMRSLDATGGDWYISKERVL